MPVHYAIGVNIIYLNIDFDKQKNKNVLYGKTFINPSIKITLDESSQSIPYRTNVLYNGCTINFSTHYTGNVKLEITETE